MDAFDRYVARSLRGFCQRLGRDGDGSTPSRRDASDPCTVSDRYRDSCQSIFLSDGGDRYIRTVCDTVAGADSGLQVLLFDFFLHRLSRGLVAGKKDTRDGIFGLFSRGAATEALEKR